MAWISVSLLQGGYVVGTDTYEILAVEQTEGGVNLLLPSGSLELRGQLSIDFKTCAEAIASNLEDYPTPEPEP